MIRIGTDFSGVGSPEMALKKLNIPHEIEFACEIDEHARKSYRAIHGEPKMFFPDITKRDHLNIPKLDLYVAGFPCQTFSIAGQRKGFDDTRGTLFFNVAEFIKINQPECFILENVKGLLSHDNGRTFETIISILSDGGGTVNQQQSIPFYEDGLGYHVFYQVLNSKNFGVPQNRERIFIVGFKKFRKFRFPVPFKLKKRLKDMLQEEVDEKYFLSDKMIESFTMHKDRHQQKGTGFQWQPKEGDDIANCLRANAALCPTDNTIIIGDLNKGGERGRVYSEDTPIVGCLTATDYKQPTQIMSDKIRRLTPAECWRLQAFPDESFFKAQDVNSDTQLYKQAGNSITVDVLCEIFKKIYQ